MSRDTEKVEKASETRLKSGAVGAHGKKKGPVLECSPDWPSSWADFMVNHFPHLNFVKHLARVQPVVVMRVQQ